MTVIATDGFSVEPIVVERIISLSGERYDVVLNAGNDSDLSKMTRIFDNFNSKIYLNSFFQTKH